MILIPRYVHVPEWEGDDSWTKPKLCWRTNFRKMRKTMHEGTSRLTKATLSPLYTSVAVSTLRCGSFVTHTTLVQTLGWMGPLAIVPVRWAVNIFSREQLNYHSPLPAAIRKPNLLLHSNHANLFTWGLEHQWTWICCSAPAALTRCSSRREEMSVFMKQHLPKVST